MGTWTMKSQAPPNKVCKGLQRTSSDSEHFVMEKLGANEYKPSLLVENTFPRMSSYSHTKAELVHQTCLWGGHTGVCSLNERTWG